jgi:hypothetical protein
MSPTETPKLDHSLGDCPTLLAESTRRLVRSTGRGAIESPAFTSNSGG